MALTQKSNMLSALIADADPQLFGRASTSRFVPCSLATTIVMGFDSGNDIQSEGIAVWSLKQSGRMGAPLFDRLIDFLDGFQRVNNSARSAGIRLLCRSVSKTAANIK